MALYKNKLDLGMEDAWLKARKELIEVVDQRQGDNRRVRLALPRVCLALHLIIIPPRTSNKPVWATWAVGVFTGGLVPFRR